VVLYLGNDPFTKSKPWEFECYRDSNMPVEYPLVIGFEDLRLFSYDGELHGSATMRQLAADGQCEQGLSRLEATRVDGKAALLHTNVQRMLREPRVCEKNWAPIAGDTSIEFMYRPGLLVRPDGNFCYHGGISTSQRQMPIRTDNMSGSSQVVPFPGGR